MAVLHFGIHHKCLICWSVYVLLILDHRLTVALYEGPTKVDFIEKKEWVSRMLPRELSQCLPLHSLLFSGTPYASAHKHGLFFTVVPYNHDAVTFPGPFPFFQIDLIVLKPPVAPIL